jgi:hypothetical protein
VRFTFSLDAIKDARYIQKLALEPNLSAAVRAAIMAFYDLPTHKELDAKLDQVLDALRNVQVVSASSTETAETPSEPARARSGLDKMKARFRR